MSALYLQLYSLRKETAADAEGTVRSVKDLGYDGVETAGDYGWTAARWCEVLSASGLTVVGAHLGLPVLEGALDRQMEFQAAIGNRRLIVPGLARELHTPEGFREAADRLNRLAATVKPEGFEVFFHNHASEFVALSDGTRGMDILLQGTDPDLVRFEFDTYWLERAGVDSLAFLTEYADRTGMVHAKELRKSDGADVPAGQGDVPFAAILQLARVRKWPVVLEYEGENAVEAVRAGAAHLRPLL
jgi:sugar phosphate isomerase/epimerase